MVSQDRNITRLHVRQGTTPQTVPCRFCQRVNPEDAKYCNGCGAPLDVARCGTCGAVNEGAASTCATCGEVLAKRQSDDLFMPLPPQTALIPGMPAPGILAPRAESRDAIDAPLFLLDDPPPAEAPRAAVPEAAAGQPPKSSARGAMLALVAIAIGGAVAFTAYRPSGPVLPASERATPLPAPTATSSTAPVPAAAPVPKPAVAPTATRTAPPGPAREPERPPAASGETAGAVPVRPVAPAAPPAKRAVIERAPPESAKSKVGPCTEAIAALGLCTLDPAQKTQP
jgi:hypothetical protein